MNKPTKRQQAIIELLPHCEILCDVGCDHGVIGASALINGIAKKVVFTDISKPCLQKAEKLCALFSLSPCEFICQDGISKIVCDCAVIAGMGGLEIIKILQEAQTLPKKLVLQPMRDTISVRRYLSNFYRIVTDKVVQDRKFYDIMYLEEGKDTLTRDEETFGRTNLAENSQDFCQYLKRELKIANNILSKTDKPSVAEYRNDIIRLQKGK